MFKVFTVGWDPAFADYLLGPVARRMGIEFTHGVVGDSRRVGPVARAYPGATWVALAKPANEALPDPDLEMLASLESVGVPTVRSMVRGDRVLRHRSPSESLGYATLISTGLLAALKAAEPDVVLGSFDNIHSGLALGIAKQQGIPWVALAFSVIPDDLTWFCRGMTPDTLLPSPRAVDDRVRRQAWEVLTRYRSRSVRVLAYRPPATLKEKTNQILVYARNAGKRVARRTVLGVDRFTYPTLAERIADVTRRSANQLRLPTRKMLRTPPNGPFVFFPLHMAPESSVDTWAPMYQNQLELAVQLSLAVPIGVEVVIKLHFSDPDNYSPAQLQPLLGIPRVSVAHPDAPSRSFIERSTLVGGIAGTANLEAALLGKPVLLFGDSPYQHFPRSERAGRPDQLPAQIRRMIDAVPPSDEEIGEAFAAYIARYMPGRINDWTVPVQEHEFDKLAECFTALRAHVDAPGVRQTWYEQPPFAAWRDAPAVAVHKADALARSVV